MGAHDGHRERLREKVVKDATELHEKLEVFLFTALPRVNTNEIAHELLNRFGGIDGVMSASIDRLMTVDGIGRTAAIQIRNLASLVREYQLALCHPDEISTSKNELYKLLNAIFACSTHELVCMLMFSAKDKYIGYKIIGEGDFFDSTVYARQAIMYAVQNKAESVIIAHNHPDKLAIPSEQDKTAAEKIKIRFENEGIHLRAQYVVADGRCIEF